MVQSMMRYMTEAPATGAGKYHGAVAANYDAKRKNDAKWVIEQRTIEAMLADLPKGDWVLDCPCGTGRFLPFYLKQELMVRAVDLSKDMLEQAAGKLIDAGLKDEMERRVRWGIGDVRSLDALPPKSNDASVACRITRWLSPTDCHRMMKELQRVTRKRIIVTARVANHPHARPIDLFEASLMDGWRLEEDAEGYHPDYRILRFAADGE